MNYKLFRDTKSQQFLADFEKEPQLRPQVGDIITVGNIPTSYKITRQEPTDAPLNVTVTYFCNPINNTPDTITMGRDIGNLTRTMRHLGR